MTDDDLTNLERLDRAATPGPWESGSSTCCPDMGWVDGPAGKGTVCPQYQGTKTTHTMDAYDAELIAEMRNALPALLTEVRRLRSNLTEGEADAWQVHAQAEAQAHLATTKRLIETEAALTAARADAAHLRHLLERTVP